MFGLDFNDIDQQAQPNQYSNGQMSNVDNTSWMQPSYSFQNQQSSPSPSTGFTGTGNTGFAGNAAEVSATRQQPQPMLQPGNGTAIDAVNYGWMMPSFDPNNQLRAQPYYGNFGENYKEMMRNNPGIMAPRNWSPQADNANYGGGQVGQFMPGGYDPGKWADQSHNTPKYEAGRILSKYDPNKGIEQARKELEAAGYSIVGKDKIRINKGEYAGHVIDVGFSFSDPNAKHSWQWLDETEGGSTPGGANNQTPMINPNQQIQSFLAQLMNSAGRRGMRQKMMRVNAQNKPALG